MKKSERLNLRLTLDEMEWLKKMSKKFRTKNLSEVVRRIINAQRRKRD